MLRVLLLLTLTLTIVLAEDDPVAVWCWDKCTAWDEKESECIQQKNCYPNGKWDEEITLTCVNECFDIAAPCRTECVRSYDACAHNCFRSDDYQPGCFESCFDSEFNPGQPE